MAYTRTTWRTGETPLSAGNMNNIEDGIEEALAIVQSIAEVIYPVGCYFETSDTEFDPNVTFGGTWILETAGLVHVSAGAGYAVNGARTNTKDGGEATVTLNASQIPAHTHGSKSPTGTINLRYGSVTGGAGGIIGNIETTWPGSHANVSTTTQSNPKYHHITVTATHEHNSVGGGQAHNNMQPYIIVNRWHRTA